MLKGSMKFYHHLWHKKLRGAGRVHGTPQLPVTRTGRRRSPRWWRTRCSRRSAAGSAPPCRTPRTFCGRSCAASCGRTPAPPGRRRRATRQSYRRTLPNPPVSVPAFPGWIRLRRNIRPDQGGNHRRCTIVTQSLQSPIGDKIT